MLTELLEEVEPSPQDPGDADNLICESFGDAVVALRLLEQVCVFTPEERALDSGWSLSAATDAIRRVVCRLHALQSGPLLVPFRPERSAEPSPTQGRP